MIYPTNKDTWRFEDKWSSSTNILGLFVFAVITGVAIAVWGRREFTTEVL